MIRSFILSVLFFVVGMTCPGLASAKVTVLTSLDVVQALGMALTQDTSIEVVNVVPKGYFMMGQDAYFKKHQKTFFAQAVRADAVLTIGAAWPADSLYKWARRGNIHVVNIDVSQPLDGYGAGVPLIAVGEGFSPYVWRSPANLTRMAAIAADDLSRLVPAEAPTILANLKALQTRLFTLRNTYEQAFLELDVVDVAALTNGFTYLTDEFGLNIVFSVIEPEEHWTETRQTTIAGQLKEDMLSTVVCAWEPGEIAKSVLARGGAHPVVLKRYVFSSTEAPDVSLVKWYEGNLSRLLKVLKTESGG
ncbi:zinc ABC transporter solute-binding protein [Pseudodesulfovibrio sp. JC047]|uniref:metal ABC transporter solute-binding protein, Zn/Mn family n=1 Tax=Pseudodesulfovibrio sp. JC047 TaxID=2683199 RepID=UPI0013D05AC7|nr:zinc ABC transporter substrate-binding protein [Pseudodesulfovibrio sp. JC047]NDV19059.1 zinc ABC transporter solute-binding protein [Pseudodesulfovibrio sp. JC047]